MPDQQEIALAQAVPTFRFHHVDDNQMAPTYFAGGWLIFMPVNDFKGEGVYIVDWYGKPIAYRFQAAGLPAPAGHLRVLKDSKGYPESDPVSREWFRENVLGRVVGSLRVPPE